MFLLCGAPRLLLPLLFVETLKSLFGDIDVLLFSLRRLFLEAVQDVNNVFNLLQIKHAVPCPRILVPKFIDARSDRPHRFAIRRRLTALYPLQGIPQIPLEQRWGTAAKPPANHRAKLRLPGEETEYLRTAYQDTWDLYTFCSYVRSCDACEPYQHFTRI